jgi:cytochrome c-type biogenesis protein CcmH
LVRVLKLSLGSLVRVLKLLKLSAVVVVLGFMSTPPLKASADIRSFAHEFEQLSEEQRAEVRAVAYELRCPTCTGLSVLESDAPFSLQMRTAVLQQVKEKQSKEEILKFFVERYGLWILREPPREGFHLLAWLLPCALLIAGPGVLVYLRYRTKRPSSAQRSSRSTREPGPRPPRRRELLEEMQSELAAKRLKRAGLGREERSWS